MKETLNEAFKFDMNRLMLHVVVMYCQQKHTNIRNVTLEINYPTNGKMYFAQQHKYLIYLFFHAFSQSLLIK